MTALVCGHLVVHLCFAGQACIGPAQNPSPTVSSFGFSRRYQTLSRQSGVPFSEGNSHESGSLSGRWARHSRRSALVPGDSATIRALLLPLRPLGESRFPLYTLRSTRIEFSEPHPIEDRHTEHETFRDLQNRESQADFFRCHNPPLPLLAGRRRE